MPYARYEKVFDEYAKEKLITAQWDDDLFSKLDELLGSLYQNTLVVIGGPGCGKTSNICLLHDLFQGEDLSGFLYLPYFCAISDGADNIDHMLEYFIHRTEKAAGADYPDSLRRVHPDWEEKIDLRAMSFESRIVYLMNTVNSLDFHPVILAIDDFDKLDFTKRMLFFEHMSSLMPQGMRIIMTMSEQHPRFAISNRVMVHKTAAPAPPPTAVLAPAPTAAPAPQPPLSPCLLSKRASAASFMDRGDAALGKFFEACDEKKALSDFEEASKGFYEVFKTTRDPHDFFRHAEANVKIGLTLVNTAPEKACEKFNEASNITFAPSQALPCPEMKYTMALLHFGLGLTSYDWRFTHFQEAAGRIAQIKAADHVTAEHKELASLIYGFLGNMKPQYIEKSDDMLRELYEETGNTMYKERIGKSPYEI